MQHKSNTLSSDSVVTAISSEPFLKIHQILNAKAEEIKDCLLHALLARHTTGNTQPFSDEDINIIAHLKLLLEYDDSSLEDMLHEYTTEQYTIKTLALLLRFTMWHNESDTFILEDHKNGLAAIIELMVLINGWKKRS